MFSSKVLTNWIDICLPHYPFSFPPLSFGHMGSILTSSCKGVSNGIHMYLRQASLSLPSPSVFKWYSQLFSIVFILTSSSKHLLKWIHICIAHYSLLPPPPSFLKLDSHLSSPLSVPTSFFELQSSGIHSHFLLQSCIEQDWQLSFTVFIPISSRRLLRWDSHLSSAEFICASSSKLHSIGIVICLLNYLYLFPPPSFSRMVFTVVFYSIYSHFLLQAFIGWESHLSSIGLILISS